MERIKIPKGKKTKIPVKSHKRRVPKGTTQVKKHSRQIVQKGLPTARKQIRKTVKRAPQPITKSYREGQTVIQQVNAMDFLAFARWGARDFVLIDDGVQFKVKGSKHRGKAIIKVNPMDTYDIEIGRMDMRNLEWKSKRVVEGIYVDNLISVLDSLIG